MCMDVDSYKIVNVPKTYSNTLQVSDFPALPYPCLYADEFSCQHVAMILTEQRTKVWLGKY